MNTFMEHNLIYFLLSQRKNHLVKKDGLKKKDQNQKEVKVKKKK